MSNRESNDMPMPQNAQAAGEMPAMSPPVNMPMPGDSDMPPEIGDAPPMVDRPATVGPADAPVELGPKGSDSVVKVKEVNTGFWVTAERKGFYNNLRVKPGDRFMIKSKADWGSWMMCDDARTQKELEANLKFKINKARQN